MAQKATKENNRWKSKLQSNVPCVQRQAVHTPHRPLLHTETTASGGAYESRVFTSSGPLEHPVPPARLERVVATALGHGSGNRNRNCCFFLICPTWRPERDWGESDTHARSHSTAGNMATALCLPSRPVWGPELCSLEPH